MSSSLRGASSRVGTWLPVVLMMAVIAMESTQYLGADHTDGPLRFLYQAVFGPVTDARWEVIHHHIRKCGHFIGYGLLGLSWLRAWLTSLARRSFLHSALLAMIAVFLTASADEIHQAFLPNRTSSPWDVLIDCSGALALQILAYLAIRTRQPRPMASAA
jgi:VanZ family protein